MLGTQQDIAQKPRWCYSSLTNLIFYLMQLQLFIFPPYKNRTAQISQQTNLSLNSQTISRYTPVKPYNQGRNMAQRRLDFLKLLFLSLFC